MLCGLVTKYVTRDLACGHEYVEHLYLYLIYPAVPDLWWWLLLMATLLMIRWWENLLHLPEFWGRRCRYGFSTSPDTPQQLLGGAHRSTCWWCHRTALCWIQDHTSWRYWPLHGRWNQSWSDVHRSCGSTATTLLLVSIHQICNELERC